MALASSFLVISCQHTNPLPQVAIRRIESSTIKRQTGLAASATGALAVGLGSIEAVSIGAMAGSLVFSASPTNTIPALTNSLPAIAEFTRKRQLVNDPPETTSEVFSSGAFLIKMRGLSGQVVRARRYWERVDILAAMVQGERGNAKLVVVVDGSYSAGGKPQELTGYSKSFESTGYLGELGLYTTEIANLIEEALTAPSSPKQTP